MSMVDVEDQNAVAAVLQIIAYTRRGHIKQPLMRLLLFSGGTKPVGPKQKAEEYNGKPKKLRTGWKIHKPILRESLNQFKA